MQHSQLRSKNEVVKLFAHKNPATVQKTLKVLEFDGVVATDVTPAFSVTDLNTGYFSTEIVTPNKNTYLLVMFCGSPIVLRVGEPELQFLFYTDQGIDVPFTHYDEFGTSLEESSLTELVDGFYHHGPISEDLGYIEVFNRPHILSIPYCEKGIGVQVQVIWNAKVVSRKFGVKTQKIKFNQITNKVGFKQSTVQQKFSTSTVKKLFTTKVNAVKFKTKTC